jgi:hypothetical protein
MKGQGNRNQTKDSNLKGQIFRWRFYVPHPGFARRSGNHLSGGVRANNLGGNLLQRHGGLSGTAGYIECPWDRLAKLQEVLDLLYHQWMEVGTAAGV